MATTADKSTAQQPLLRKRSDLKHISKSIGDIRTLINSLSVKSNKVTEKPIVYLDFSINSQPLKRIRIKLYYDQVPLTAENFRQLCTHEKVCHFIL